MKSKVIAIAATALVAVGAVAGVFAGMWYQDNRKPNFTGQYVLYVYPDTPVSVVKDSLVANNLVVKMKSLDRTFKKEKVAESMKPGRYVIDANCPSIYVARMLTRGWQTAQNLTLSGTIRSKEKLASIISNQMMVSYDEVWNAMHDTVFLKQYDTDTVQLFSLFLPDTYQIYWTSSIDEIFARFKKEYDAFWTPERVEKAKAQGLTPKQASTVASIVAGETRAEQEFSKIAGVYLNRLHIGMKLQADPTVAYCFNYTLNRILLKHLEVDSPYNTYKYLGLPPGPINVPGKKYIDAVLNPDQHGYLYFCANSSFDGTHKFAVNYSEHLLNAHEFQAALTKRNRERAAAK